MAEQDWFDELTDKYEFTVVQQTDQGQAAPIAARYMKDEGARIKSYLKDQTERLKAEGWRPLTDEITAVTTAIVLVREKRGYILSHQPRASA